MRYTIKKAEEYYSSLSDRDRMRLQYEFEEFYTGGNREVDFYKWIKKRLIETKGNIPTIPAKYEIQKELFLKRKEELIKQGKWIDSPPHTKDFIENIVKSCLEQLKKI